MPPTTSRADDWQKAPFVNHFYLSRSTSYFHVGLTESPDHAITDIRKPRARYKEGTFAHADKNVSTHAIVVLCGAAGRH
jgi:hypothetical protein